MCLMNSADRGFWRENRCRTVDYVSIPRDNSWVEFSGGESKTTGVKYPRCKITMISREKVHIISLIISVPGSSWTSEGEAPTFMK